MAGRQPGRPIAFVSGIDPVARPGGHPSYVNAHALAARAAGFSPQVFCVSDKREVEETDYGTLHRVPTAFRHFLVGPAYPRTMARAIADLLESSSHPPPHLVHGFGLWADTAVHVTEELARRGISSVAVASAYTAVVHEWRGLFRGLRRNTTAAALWYRAWYPWVRTVAARTERRGYRGSSLVLVNYESVARLLRGAVGGSLRLRTIPYAAPAAFAASDRLRPDEPPATLDRLLPAGAPLVVAVSRQDARKGIDVLIRALARLKNDGVGFRAALIGPGRLLSEHRALVTRLGLEAQVALPGQVREVLPYLEAAEVFVLPSLQEGSGSIALLEALQAGCPIVASSCDGIPEDIVDGEHGLLVPPGDERALAGALRAVISDSALRSRLASASRRLHDERFSADAFTHALREIYSELGVRP